MLMSTMPKIEPLLVVITDHDSNRKHITLCLFSRQALPIYRGHLNCYVVWTVEMEIWFLEMFNSEKLKTYEE